MRNPLNAIPRQAPPTPDPDPARSAAYAGATGNRESAVRAALNSVIDDRLRAELRAIQGSRTSTAVAASDLTAILTVIQPQDAP